MKKQDKLALRREQTHQLCEKLLSMGYQQTDLTISVEKANSSAVLTAIPFMVCIVALYLLTAGWQGLLNVEWDLLGVLILLLIIVHELIHGVFFALFAPSHGRAVAFGVMWKSLNPIGKLQKPLRKTIRTLRYGKNVKVLTNQLGRLHGVMEDLDGTLKTLQSLNTISANSMTFTAEDLT